MKNLRRAVMWCALVLIILLIFLSMSGAFLGSEKAKNFFNCPALSVFWLAFGLILTVGLAAFRRLTRIPGLLLVHAGCILILGGSMAGSKAGHKLRQQLFGVDKFGKGSMTIFEGHSENRVTLEEEGHIKELPFSLRLKDFRIEYYKPEYLHIQSRQGQDWKIPVETGRKLPLGPDFGSVTILRAFENFKITIEGESKTIIDDPQPGYNPALEVQIEEPNGTVTTRYVFERFPGHTHSEDKFLMSYRRTIRDYVSDVQVIIEDGQSVAEKSIEVNHPLYFGGYHFYQHSYDDQAGQYTILTVASDTGLNLVYAGYLMLGAGVLWHFWLRHIFTKTKSKRRIDGN